MNKKEIQALAETFSKQVEHFDRKETECLIQEFYVFLGEPTSSRRAVHGLTKGKFISVLHKIFGLTDDLMTGRVFRTFDKDNDGVLSVKEWLEGLSVFLRGTLDEQISYTFAVYDLNGDNALAREEILHMLKNSFIRQPNEEDPDEKIKDLVDIIIRKMDYDGDSRISFEDFKKAVKDENLLLEAFGACLPDYRRIEKFERRVFQE